MERFPTAAFKLLADQWPSAERSRLVPQRHRARAELQPVHELEVDVLGEPASSVGPWPAIRGWTTNSYPSTNPSSASANGSRTPPVYSPRPRLVLQRLKCDPFRRSNALPPPIANLRSTAGEVR